MTENAGFRVVVRKVSEVLDQAVGILCAILFSSMTAVVLLGVFFRYVLNSPLSWSEEVSRYLMIWGASVAISMGIKANEHVGLTVLLDLLKAKLLRLILLSIIFVCVLGFLVFMFIYSTQMALEARSRFTLDLGISMLLPTLAVPVAMALSAVQLVLSFALKPRAAAEHAPDQQGIDI